MSTSLDPFDRPDPALAARAVLERQLAYALERAELTRADREQSAARWDQGAHGVEQAADAVRDLATLWDHGAGDPVAGLPPALGAVMVDIVRRREGARAAGETALAGVADVRPTPGAPDRAVALWDADRAAPWVAQTVARWRASGVAEPTEEDARAWAAAAMPNAGEAAHVAPSDARTHDPRHDAALAALWSRQTALERDGLRRADGGAAPAPWQDPAALARVADVFGRPWTSNARFFRAYATALDGAPPQTAPRVRLEANDLGSSLFGTSAAAYRPHEDRVLIGPNDSAGLEEFVRGERYGSTFVGAQCYVHEEFHRRSPRVRAAAAAGEDLWEPRDVEIEEGLVQYGTEALLVATAVPSAGELRHALGHRRGYVGATGVIANVEAAAGPAAVAALWHEPSAYGRSLLLGATREARAQQTAARWTVDAERPAVAPAPELDAARRAPCGAAKCLDSGWMRNSWTAMQNGWTGAATRSRVRAARPIAVGARCRGTKLRK